jgi:ATP-binding cassette subfamily C protein CydD
MRPYSHNARRTVSETRVVQEQESSGRYSAMGQDVTGPYGLISSPLLREAAKVRLNLTLTVGAGLLAGVVLVGQARFLSRVIGQVFLKGATLSDVSPLLAALLGLALARAALSWASEVTANRVAGRVKTDLRQRLTTHLLDLGPAYTQGERSGELTNTAVEGIEALDAYFSQYLPQLALAALVPLTLLVFVFQLDLLSGVVLLLTAPIIPVFMILIGNLADGLTQRQWTSLSRMSAHFLDVLQGLTTLKLLGRSRDQIQTIARISDRFRQTTLGVLRVAFLSALVMEMVATLSTAVVAVEIGLRLLYGRMAFEGALFILILAPDFYLPLRLLGTRFHAGMSGIAAARRIFEVLDTPAVPVSPPQAEEIKAEGVHFTDVHYAYEDGQRPALRGASFDIPYGQKVALVGPSGAGKSTVTHLLLRFIEPDRGSITAGGIALGKLPVTEWRAKVAWVPQNPYLFHTSVAQNIRLARPEASLDAVIWAARQAHAHGFIQELSQGYDTLIGERGARLSGGQAQRIALARAFLKDAPLLIFDEATSNLDPEHEARLQDSLERLMKNRTVLMIAHRLSAVYRADHILVMDRGQVVEQGAHADLLEKGGLYRRLIAAYSAPPEVDQ